MIKEKNTQSSGLNLVPTIYGWISFFPICNKKDLLNDLHNLFWYNLSLAFINCFSSYFCSYWFCFCAFDECRTSNQFFVFLQTNKLVVDLRNDHITALGTELRWETKSKFWLVNILKNCNGKTGSNFMKFQNLRRKVIQCFKQNEYYL